MRLFHDNFSFSLVSKIVIVSVLRPYVTIKYYLDIDLQNLRDKNLHKTYKI